MVLHTNCLFVNLDDGMKRTQEDAEKTRKAILDAGLKLFMEKGYNYTSMQDIAKEANVTRGAIYWHFKKKEDFVIAVADSIYQETSEKVNKFFSQGTTLTEKISITLRNLGYWYLEDEQICLKRNVLSSLLITKNQTLIDRIFHNIYPDEDFPSDQDFIPFIIRKMGEHFNLPGLSKCNHQEVQEGFLLLTSFLEGFISIIMRAKVILTRSTIDNVVNRFMEGFSHSFRHILEEK